MPWNQNPDPDDASPQLVCIDGPSGLSQACTQISTLADGASPVVTTYAHYPSADVVSNVCVYSTGDDASLPEPVQRRLACRELMWYLPDQALPEVWEAVIDALTWYLRNKPRGSLEPSLGDAFGGLAERSEREPFGVPED